MCLLSKNISSYKISFIIHFFYLKRITGLYVNTDGLICNNGIVQQKKQEVHIERQKNETGKDKKTINLDAVCIIVFEPLVKYFTIFTFSVCVTASFNKIQTDLNWTYIAADKETSEQSFEGRGVLVLWTSLFILLYINVYLLRIFGRDNTTTARPMNIVVYFVVNKCIFTAHILWVQFEFISKNLDKKNTHKHFKREFNKCLPFWMQWQFSNWLLLDTTLLMENYLKLPIITMTDTVKVMKYWSRALSID